MRVGSDSTPQSSCGSWSGAEQQHVSSLPWWKLYVLLQGREHPMSKAGFDLAQRVPVRTINVTPPKMKNGSWNGDLAGCAHTRYHWLTFFLFQIYSSNTTSTVWGRPDFRLPPTYAAFANGVAVRSFPCLFNCYTIVIIFRARISQKSPNFHIWRMTSLKFREMKWPALSPM